MGNRIQIFTDGSCYGNPGPGGYCAIIRNGGYVRTVTGNVPYSTNNKMELMAVIKGLSAVRPHSAVTVFSDSYYITGAMNEGRVEQWRTNGWRRIKTGEPIQNREMWAELLRIIERKDLAVKYVKLKAHKGQKLNEMADLLARMAAKAA